VQARQEDAAMPAGEGLAEREPWLRNEKGSSADVSKGAFSVGFDS